MTTDVIYIDGTPSRLLRHDLNNDGIIGGIEEISPKLDQEIITPKQQTELGETIDIGFRDKIDREIGTSTIDLMGNLEIDEANIIFVINSMVKAKMLMPEALYITRMFIRMSISRKARGRNDWKDIAIQKRASDQQNIKKGLLNFMGQKPKDEPSTS